MISGIAIEVSNGAAARTRRDRKGWIMWVFDGEQWIDEGAAANESTVKIPATELPYEMFLPELQIQPVTRTREEERLPLVPLPRI